MSSHTEGYYDAQPGSARRAQTRAAAARWFAYVALALALGLGVTFAVQLGIFGKATPKTETQLAPVEKPNQITGGPSKIAGFDKNKLPFEITASKGVQDEVNENLVHLETVDSVFARPNGAKLTINSSAAAYETKTKDLELQGSVVFAEGDRFRAHMDKASVNMEDQTLTSRSPVAVDIIGGKITADNLTISSNGERIIFKGGVKARFMTNRPKPGDGE
jgi:lipopolysaccharide export system protein LptC